jgi:hypothetical protein
MLTCLKHYLERHAGVPQIVAWPRRKVEMPREAPFQKLLGRGGLFAEPAIEQLRAGQPYSLLAATREPFTGRVEFVRPSRGICVTVNQLNDALFWLTIEGRQANMKCSDGSPPTVCQPGKSQHMARDGQKSWKGFFPEAVPRNAKSENYPSYARRSRIPAAPMPPPTHMVTRP